MNTKQNGTTKPNIGGGKSDYTPIFLALRNSFKRYGGGMASFSQLIGKSYNTVKSQFNPNKDDMPTLETFLLAIEHNPDPVFLNAICQLADGSFVPNVDTEDSNTDINSTLINLITGLSELTTEAAIALSDGHISQAEKAIISKKLETAQHKINIMNAALAGDL